MGKYTQEQIAEAKRILASIAGTDTPAKPRKGKSKSSTPTKFSQLAALTPTRKGKGSKFTITLGDLTFACEDRGNGKVVSHTTNGVGDERWIVFRPSDPAALTSAPYLAVVARKYGLIK